MRVLSAIQPTGVPHLGNYFGAIAEWVRLQNEGHDGIWFIADMHSITLAQSPEMLQENIWKTAATIIALGIDPEKSLLFVQSDVKLHAEFAWYLSCVVPVGELTRMIQYKEKTKRSGSTDTGLLIYPILMAADILMYGTELVPVGVDQAQHLELTRIICRKLASRVGIHWKEPKTLHSVTKKVMGLDGTAKMSKSLDNHISFDMSNDEIRKRILRAVTDTNRKRRGDPGNPDVCAIFALHKLFSNSDTVIRIDEQCRSAEIGCVDCKKELIDRIIAFVEPVRNEMEHLLQDRGWLSEVLRRGAEKARELAEERLQQLRHAFGTFGVK